jgi:hypothetical protein
MCEQSTTDRALVASMIARLAAAIPERSRRTFTELLIGAAVTASGHVTDAIAAAGHFHAWTAYFWCVGHARWSWLAVWAALLDLLKQRFAPAVWYVILDDTVVERCSSRAPECRCHFNHTAKPNRPRFILGQGWVCLAAVVERAGRIGAVPLMLRLVRAGGNRGKLDLGRLMLRLLGDRLGRVRLLVDAWYMRARLIEAAVQYGHCVIGRARKDLALYDEPPPRRPGQRGAPRKYGARMTPERVDRLPVVRTAQILYGHFEVVRYRTCCVAARFLKGMVVRAVWIELERPDRPSGCTETRLLICTDPMLPAPEVIRAYARRWAVEPLFFDLKHRWGLKDAWQQSRKALIRWVTILAAGYALNQILAFTDPALLGSLARPAPWRRPGERTAGIIRTGLDRILRQVGIAGLMTAKSPEIEAANLPAGYPAGTAALSAA